MAGSEVPPVPVSEDEVRRLSVLLMTSRHHRGRQLLMSGPDERALLVTSANGWAFIQLMLWRGIKLRPIEARYAQRAHLVR